VKSQFANTVITDWDISHFLCTILFKTTFWTQYRVSGIYAVQVNCLCPAATFLLSVATNSKILAVISGIWVHETLHSNHSFALLALYCFAVDFSHWLQYQLFPVCNYFWSLCCCEVLSKLYAINCSLQRQKQQQKQFQQLWWWFYSKIHSAMSNIMVSHV
jgi:hypothetical protein